MSNQRGNFGNPLSKKCDHNFMTHHWIFKKCLKCGAVDHSYNKYGTVETKSFLKRIFTK